MPQIIEVPGMGQVSFPDGMTDADISTAIQRNLPRSAPPSAVGLMAQQAMDAETAAQNAPSMGGSFFREAGRSVGPGLAGMAAGSASGAAIGAAGLNPLTVALGAVAGGVTGFMGARKLQDVAFDAVAPNSFMGTQSAEQDMAANKWSTMLGGAIGGGGAPGPLRGVMAIPRLMTAEGRQVLGTGLRQGATVAARQASNDILEPIVGAGVGVGLGAAHGADGAGMAEQAGLGLLFNRGWHNVLRAKPPTLSTDSQHGVQGDPATGSPSGDGVVPVETNAAVVTPMVGDGVRMTGPSRAFDIMESNALANRLKTAQPLETPLPVSEPLTFDGGPQVRGPMVRGPVVEGPIVRGPIVEGPRVGSEFPAIEQPQTLRSPAVVAPDGPTMLGPVVDRPFVDGPLGPDVLGPAKIKVGQDTFTDSPAPEVIPQAKVRPAPVAQAPDLPQTAANIIALARELDPVAFKAAMEDTKAYIQSRKDDGVPLSPVLEGDQVTLAAQGVLTKHTYDPRAMKMLDGYGEDQFSRLTPKAIEPPAPVEPSRQLGQRPFNSTDVANRLRAPVEPPAPVVPVTPATPLPPLKGSVALATGRLNSAKNQLAKLEASGKASPEQIAKRRASITTLEQQIEAAGPAPDSRARQLQKRVDEVHNSGEFELINRVRQNGGFAPQDRQAGLIDRNNQRGAKLNEQNRRVADGFGETRDDAARASNFPDTPGGNLAAETLRSLHNKSPNAQTVDQLADALGMTVPEFHAKLNSELESIHRNNGPKANALDATYDRQERQLIEFDKAVEEAPAASKATPDELGLEKGDTLTIDGEPLRVIAATDESVTLRDHDKFGDQVVSNDTPIPADNLNSQAKARIADEAPDAIAADEAATRRQAEEHMAEKPKPLTPEHDAAYTKAVESGDEVTQQRLVDEAGESAGLGKPWYHGGKKGITKFSELIRPGSTRDQESLHSQGIWLTRSRGGNPEIDGSSYDATTYAGLDGQVYRLFAKIKNPARIFDEEIARKRITIDSLKAEGFDGADLAQSGFKVAFDPAQIHSAEPVVRDSSGRIIPLSERFGSKPADDFALKPHSSDAEIKAEQAAAKQKEELAKRQSAPLKGSAGDLTPDIFGEGDTPLFNERRDTPQQKSLIDGLKAHQDEVRGWIKGEQKSGRLNSMPVDILGAQAYDAALTSVIKLMETGVRIGKAVRTVIADIKKTRQLSRDEEATIKAALIAKSQDHLRFAGERDAKLMLEMPKIAEELVAQGKTPTQQDLIAALAARFPDQAPYIKANGDKIFKDMMFARDKRLSRTTDSQREWGEWTDSAIDGTRRMVDSVTKGAPLTNVKHFATNFHATYMTGIGNKMRHLAEGNITGNKSNAWGKWTEDLVGLAKGKDGVHRVSTDLAMNRDVTTFANHLDRIKTDLNPMLNAMPRGERKAFMERVGDHITDASRDGELANQPELKRAVEAYVKIREDLLKHMKDSGVEVGDVGPRSMRRVLDRPTILGNPQEFMKQAANAYKAKWRAETAALNKEAAGLDPIKNKDRLASIQKELVEIAKRDAADSARKYLTNIEADEVGITSDGNDLFSHNNGNPSSMKSREFGPEADQLLGKFYLRDPDAILRREIGDSVRAAGVARTFSGPALDPQGNPRPNGEIDPMAKWKKLRQDLIDEGNPDMIPMAATLLKEHFNLGGQDSPAMRTALEIAHTHTQLAFLARSAFSSLGEPALAGIRAGSLRAVGEGYVKTIKGMVSELRGLGPDEARIISNAIGTSSDGFNSILAANRFLDSYAVSGKSGELVAMFHAKTWLTALTNATHAASVDISHGFIRTQLQLRQAGGKYKTTAGKSLNEIGITTADIPAMLKFTDDFAKSTDKVKLLTADTPEAKMYRDALHLVRMSGGSLHVLRGTRPQHANSPVGGMFYALKSFLFAFQDQVLSRHARLVQTAVKGETMVDGAMEKLSAAERRKMIRETAQAVATLAAAQYGIQVLRESLFSDPARMKEENKTPAEKARMRAYSVATRSSFFGGYDIIFNAMTGARHGGDPSTVALGPTGGLAGSIFGQIAGIGGKKDSPNTNTHERKLTRSIFDFTAKPLANAAAATLPGYKIATPFVQFFNHPGTREALVKTVAGAPMKGGPMKKKSPGF